MIDRHAAVLFLYLTYFEFKHEKRLGKCDFDCSNLFFNSDLGSLEAALPNLNRTSGGTNTAAALDLAVNEMYRSVYGARYDAVKVSI